MSDEMNPQNFKALCKDVKDIKSALIGSNTFGQKGLVQRMEALENEVVETRKRTYDNAENHRVLDQDVKNIKKTSGYIGAGSGGAVGAIVSFLKDLV